MTTPTPITLLKAQTEFMARAEADLDAVKTDAQLVSWHYAYISSPEFSSLPAEKRTHLRHLHGKKAQWLMGVGA